MSKSGVRASAPTPNRLYFGDNLDVLTRHIPDASVNLVYLDPPFNSKAQYNVLYETPDRMRGTAQAKVFRDSWHWEEEATFCFDRILSSGGKVASIINALADALGKKDTMAYLVMMAARLIEIKRAMKPTASLYLHCDPSASHYLKIILDAIFGPDNFRNEIIWKRSSSHNRAKRWGPVHDVILFYTNSSEYTWNRTFSLYEEAYLEGKYRHEDREGRRYRLSDLTGPGVRSGDSGLEWRGVNPTSYGRHWEPPHDRALPSWFKFPNGWSDLSVRDRLEIMQEQELIRWPSKDGGRPEFRRYLESAPGQPIQDVITDIDPINSMAKERIGFPTQKPVTLLRRIIEASSNVDDVILDPFCGCGTTVHAAAEMDRKWIGVDVSYYGVRLIQRRMADNFGPDYPIEVNGIPADFVSAEALADRDQYGFQQWAVGELGCQLWNDGKKGADGGIDGEMWFYAGPDKQGRLLTQVKGGRRIGVKDIREFKDVLNTEKAQMGIFFCRARPTADMHSAAGDAGVFRIGSTTFPRLQLFTLAQWFAGQRPPMPIPIAVEMPQDKSRQRRVRRPDPAQPQFMFVMEGDLSGPREGRVLSPIALPSGALRKKPA